MMQASTELVLVVVMQVRVYSKGQCGCDESFMTTISNTQNTSKPGWFMGFSRSEGGKNSLPKSSASIIATDVLKFFCRLYDGISVHRIGEDCKLSIVAFCWNICRERNNRLFNNKNYSIKYCMRLIVHDFII